MKLSQYRCFLYPPAILQAVSNNGCRNHASVQAARHCNTLLTQTGPAVLQKWSPALTLNVRTKFLDARDDDHHEKERNLTLRQGKEYFDEAQKAKDKETFKRAVSKYLNHQGVQRRGHVEFIYASMSRMTEYRVEKDLDTYKHIMTLFPKDKMVATSTWQRELMHFPKQQQCCIDLLDLMEKNGVCPDDDVGYQILAIFGKNTYPMRKYQRMMYWIPKFKHANPYPVPYVLPEDPTALARLALERMAVDLQNTISVYQPAADSIDDTYIVSSQSPTQRDLIDAHPTDVPLYVEGSFSVWLRHRQLHYFVLRADQTELYKAFKIQKDAPEDDNELFKWKIFEEEKPKDLLLPPSIHEQEDGTVLAMCITGTGSKDSLASWIKGMQPENPRLASIPVVFQLRTPETGVEVYGQTAEEEKVAVGQGRDIS